MDILRKFTMRGHIFFWLFFIPFCLINSSANISMVNGYCLDHQRSMLLQLKNNLIFDPEESSKLVQWNQSESQDDCCQWHGVTCNKGLVIALDLSQESISGGLNNSSPLFSLQYLQSLNLALNDFHSINIPPQLNKLKNLRYLNLSDAGFEGQIPKEISHLRRLVILDLSFSSFPFISHLHEINLKLEKPNIATLVQNLTDIRELYLDGVIISSNGEEWGSALSSLEKLRVLSMSSCNLSGPIHSSLANLSDLISLDLSGNKIGGSIPSWIWQLDSLVSLNLSNNLMTNFEGSFGNLSSSNNLSMVDLSSNQLQGPISFIPKYANYLDYSNNKLSSIIPPDIGNYLPFIRMLFLSYNGFHGQIHESYCNASTLILLDLSHNNFVGTIPKCFPALSSSLRILSLSGNKLRGPIPDSIFPNSCALRFLDLSDNLLSGTIPKSLVNCKKLQIISLGKNALTGRFPCFLSNISTLGVMTLGSNKLQGSIGCPNGTSGWEMLHIIDLSNNHFSGTIPGALLSSWKAMMSEEYTFWPELGDLFFENVYNHHARSLKNILRTKLVKFIGNIGPIMHSWVIYHGNIVWISYVDMSSNYFEGPIPNELSQLKALSGLNLSDNAFLGHLPSSLGNLKNLECLDLSKNSFNGVIPQELSSLHFLQYLNLSFNHLVGSIPSGQFDTFGSDSFEGNEGLCGLPLTNKCNNEVVKESPPPDSHTTKSSIEWNFLSVELGFIVGFGMFILPLIYWKKWRLWYSKHVDDLLYRIIHKLDFQYVRHEGKTYRVLRWVY